MFQSNRIRVIVFTAIVVIICAIGTYFAIRYVNNNNSNNSNNSVIDVLPINEYYLDADNSYLGIKIGDMYFDNNIELDETDKNNVKIVGLKNKNVETKINNEIRNVINEMQDVQNNSEVQCYINANYSNVLSLGVYGLDEYIFLNYDLTTGNHLKVSDLFINNCNDIVLKKIKEGAKSSWTEKQYDNGEYDEKMQEFVFDQSGEEQFMLDIVNQYLNNNESIKFYFTNDSIIMFFEDITVILNMDEFYECVSVYKKYVTENSIFENGNLEKDEYCLTSEYNKYHALYFEEYNDNLFLNVSLHTYDETMLNDKYRNYIENKVKLLKQNSDEKSDIAKYLYLKAQIYQCNKYLDKYNELSKVHWNEYEYTMPKEDYLNSFRNKMFETLMFEEYFNVTEYDKVRINCNSIEKYGYSYISEGEVKEISLNDIFVNDYDYILVAKEKLKNAIRDINNQDYTKKHIEEIYGTGIIDKMLSNIDSLKCTNFTFKLGDIDIMYDLEYNELNGILGKTDSYIYINNVFDMNNMK